MKILLVGGLSHVYLDRDGHSPNMDRRSVVQRLMYVLTPYPSIELIGDQEDDSRFSDEQRMLRDPKLEHRELHDPHQLNPP